MAWPGEEIRDEKMKTAFGSTHCKWTSLLSVSKYGRANIERTGRFNDCSPHTWYEVKELRMRMSVMVRESERKRRRKRRKMRLSNEWSQETRDMWAGKKGDIHWPSTGHREKRIDATSAFERLKASACNGLAMVYQVKLLLFHYFAISLFCHCTCIPSADVLVSFLFASLLLSLLISHAWAID